MKNTNTVRWDKDRQRWERAPEREAPAIGRHGTPAGVIVGLAAAMCLTGVAPALAGMVAPEEVHVADGGSSIGPRSPNGNGEEDLPTAPPEETSGTDGVGSGAPDPGTAGGGSNGDGPDTGSSDPGSGGTGGTGTSDDDSDEDSTSDEDPTSDSSPEEEPSEEEESGEDQTLEEETFVDPAGFTLDLPESWERSSVGEAEAVFVDHADEAFHLRVLWEAETEATPLAVLEQRVAEPSRQADDFEEVSLVTEDAWNPEEVAFEYLTTGDEGTERALALTFQGEDGTVYVMVSTGPEEARDTLQETLETARSTFTPGTGEPQQD